MWSVSPARRLCRCCASGCLGFRNYSQMPRAGQSLHRIQAGFVFRVRQGFQEHCCPGDEFPATPKTEKFLLPRFCYSPDLIPC